MKNKSKFKSKFINISLIVILLVLIFFIIEAFTSEEKQEENPVNITTEEISKVKNKFIEKVKELQQENPDVKGWIRIEDTKINYPMVQTIDNEYYLRRNFKKEKSNYGSIFINKHSNIDNVSSNIIIYGHSMNDGQMFGELLKYKDKTFFDNHQQIRIITAKEESTYQIISVFISRVFYENETNVFRYYDYHNLKDKNIFNEYINNSKNIELYDTGQSAKYGNQIITLITCEYSINNGRIVVIAKKI